MQNNQPFCGLKKTNNQNCFICGDKIVNSNETTEPFVSKYSNWTVSILIAQALGQKFKNTKQTTFKFCKRCRSELDQYDKCIWLAKQAQKILQRLFQERILNKNTQEKQVLPKKEPVKESSNTDNQPQLDCTSEEHVEELETQTENSEYDESITNEVEVVSDCESSIDDFNENRIDQPKKKSRRGIKNQHSKTKDPHTSRKYEKRKKSEHDCNLCGLQFTSDLELKGHQESHEGLDPLQCPTCHKQLKKKGALVKHMYLHTGEKQYVCSRCGKAYIHYMSFHMHQLAHDNIREKKCEICSKLFYSTSHLNRHLKVHTGSRPWKCYCGREFAQRYNLTVHQKAHEGIRVVRKKKPLIIEPVFD